MTDANNVNPETVNSDPVISPSPADRPQKQRNSRNTSQMKRVSLYIMEDDLITLLNAQVKTDNTNKNTFVVQLLQLLLVSQAGDKFRSSAKGSGEHLVER